MIGSFQTISRLILAALLSGIIGFEREAHGRAAGLRTHILVCVGSTLIMLTSLYIFDSYIGKVPLDPTRIAANVVAGIGFLGAGTIIRSGASVMGLTTAASIWAVAGIGLAVGCGYYLGALVCTFIILTTLLVLRKVETKVPGSKD
jgi:putative Mg2+ transporter-C (MgtC) family protein